MGKAMETFRKYFNNLHALVNELVGLVPGAILCKLRAGR
jgi:hypothetical protein